MNHPSTAVSFSIVTAVLNGAATLEQTIDSVRSQGDVDAEHVVVDGGSTDGTIEIIRRHAPELGPWVTGGDRGISDAFNRGIRMSSGDVIGIISADDFLWPGALEQVRAAFAASPDADVVYGNAVYLDAEGRGVLSRPDRDLDRLRRRAGLRHAAVFVRKSAYERFGVFDEQYRLAMDYELLLRFYLAGARFVYVDAPLAAIREGGVSGRSYRRTIREARSISMRYGASPLIAHAISVRDTLQTVLKNALYRWRLTGILDAYRHRSSRFEAIEFGSLNTAADREPEAER